ncbi:MAG: hypothetical protein M8350_02160 [Methanosarcinaceae archaeon]|nr:hypothetical protein [Methanosarcinaceae archaeon]
MRKLMLISLIALIVAMLAIPASAEEGFSVTSLDAKDVDCRSSCHTPNPHTIHAGKPVSCVNCHGETLSIAIPQCENCHSGPIHDVHKGKVATEDCSYCHQSLEGVHNTIAAESVCAHCHKDLIVVHGGETESCTKCHSTAPNIVKPVKTANMDIICQACHVSDNVASVHGNESNKQACYNCHRPGEGEVSATQIPHNIHIPDVTCVACHMDEEIIIVPECTRCHDVDDLHAFGTVGIKSKDEMQCSACHPDSYFGGSKPAEVVDKTPENKVTTSDKPTSDEPTPIESGNEEPILPGFGIISAIGAIAALYFVSKRK